MREKMSNYRKTFNKNLKPIKSVGVFPDSSSVISKAHNKQDNECEAGNHKD